MDVYRHDRPDGSRDQAGAYFAIGGNRAGRPTLMAKRATATSPPTASAATGRISDQPAGTSIRSCRAHSTTSTVPPTAACRHSRPWVRGPPPRSRADIRSSSPAVALSNRRRNWCFRTSISTTPTTLPRKSALRTSTRSPGGSALGLAGHGRLTTVLAPSPHGYDRTCGMNFRATRRRRFPRQPASFRSTPISAVFGAKSTSASAAQVTTATTLYANASYQSRFDGGGFAYNGKVGLRVNW